MNSNSCNICNNSTLWILILALVLSNNKCFCLDNLLRGCNPLIILCLFCLLKNGTFNDAFSLFGGNNGCGCGCGCNN